jgi:DNA/RNA endonuclease G (NUC1)
MAMMPKDSLKNEKSIDSTFTFKQLLADNKDSIAKLPISEQQQLKKLENFNMRMQMNQEQKQFLFSLQTNFKNVSELQDAMTAINAISLLQNKANKATEFGSAIPSEGLANNNSTLSYSFKGNKFTRIAVLNKVKKEMLNEEATQAEAILLPQDLSGKLKIKLEQNGQSKEIETEISGNIEQGSKYIYNVNVNYQGGEITTDPEAKYTKWFETPVITESQLNQSNIKYVTHYTGITYDEAPLNGIEIRNYSMLYDTNLKIAYWVSYPLCGWYLEGNIGRTEDWGYDPKIATNLQANLKKAPSGYSRGHQIPSGDRQRKDCKMNNQTFYYTNMTPQLQNGLNGAIWAQLEGAVRGWSSGIDTLYVVTGAMPTTATDKQIQYAQDNNGKNIAIPKYYFKALARKVGGNYQTIAFKLDHKAYGDTQYMKYAISVSELENMTGFTFFPSLPSEVKKTLNTSQWN